MEQFEDQIVDGEGNGFATIKRTRVRVKDIVSARRNEGLESNSIDAYVAERLRELYPALTKEQILAALAFAHKNSERIKEEIERETKALKEISNSQI